MHALEVLIYALVVYMDSSFAMDMFKIVVLSNSRLCRFPKVVVRQKLPWARLCVVLHMSADEKLIQDAKNQQRRNLCRVGLVEIHWNIPLSVRSGLHPRKR